MPEKVRRALDTARKGGTKGTIKSGGARVVDVDAATVKVLKWCALGVHRCRWTSLCRCPGVRNAGRLAAQPGSVSQMFGRRVDKARCALGSGALPMLTLHGWRHSHAPILLEAGDNPKVVQERLGHTTITTTMDVY